MRGLVLHARRGELLGPRSNEIGRIRAIAPSSARANLFSGEAIVNRPLGRELHETRAQLSLQAGGLRRPNGRRIVVRRCYSIRQRLARPAARDARA